ncbi:DUF1835 domain-containing protein [Pontibacter sp. H259]|uniref:DUF1835 domain-containing protein n=1 Tax=Pontibacter sp. H259 TaxID=3133421 RepID=UPI0030C40DE9
MTYHVLNGDALVERFLATDLAGEVIIAREALVVGDVSGNTLNDFWQVRATHWGEPYQKYKSKVVAEYEKLLQAPDASEFNLWFEYDLFCQVNLWFILHLLVTTPGNKKVYSVYTSHLSKEHPHFWTGYGHVTTQDLQNCFAQRIALTDADIEFGNELWLAYKAADLQKLTDLAQQPRPAFPYLQEVVKAHIDRLPEDEEPGRPERTIRDILSHTYGDFNTVFAEFQKREGIYGFGDTQVKELYHKVLQDRNRNQSNW